MDLGAAVSSFNAANEKAAESAAEFCRRQRYVTAWNVIGHRRQRRQELREAIKSRTRSLVRQEARRTARRGLYRGLNSRTFPAHFPSLGRQLSRHHAREEARRAVKESAVHAARKAVRRAVREAENVFQESIGYESDSSYVSGASESSMSDISDVSDVSGASQISAKSDVSDRSASEFFALPPQSSDDESDPGVVYEKVASLSVLCRRSIRDHFTFNQISQLDQPILRLLDFAVPLEHE